MRSRAIYISSASHHKRERFPSSHEAQEEPPLKKTKPVPLPTPSFSVVSGTKKVIGAFVRTVKNVALSSIRPTSTINSLIFNIRRDQENICEEQQLLLTANGKTFSPKKLRSGIRNYAAFRKKPPNLKLTYQPRVQKASCSTIVRRSRRQIHDKLQREVEVSGVQVSTFLTLLEEDPAISEFLRRDVCRIYADKYLLAVTFTYMVRADLALADYTRLNFFACLYLAHDMEEDEEELKYEVLPWALGNTWRKTYALLLKARNDIFFGIDCRAVVSMTCCEQVISMEPDHWVWKRERPEYHGIALRDYDKHPNNKGSDSEEADSGFESFLTSKVDPKTLVPSGPKVACK